jgi:hypothetical protein
MSVTEGKRMSHPTGLVQSTLDLSLAVRPA